MKSGGGSIRAHGGDGRGGNVSSRVHGEDGGGGDGRGGGSVRVHGKADGSIRVQGGDNRGGSNVLSRIHGEGGVPFHVHGGGDSSIRDQGGNGGGSARSGGSSNAYGGNDHGELMVADRFTSLPDDLLGRVLSFLNVDEVARTAILSKRMRHFWKTMVLVIDDTRFKTIPNLQFVLGLVKGVMSNHTGFVERLALKRLPLTTLFGLMGSWMIGSAFCRINDLCLSFPGDKFVLPQFVFGFRSLKLLDLCNCIVIETMISLPSLTSLRLAEVDISEPTLHSIISTAKKLHTLVLQWNGGYSTLSLSVPDLCCLIVSVNPSLWDTKHQQLKNVYIHNSPKLYRLLVSTVDKHHLSVTVSGIWMPRILGHCLGTGAISLQHSNKKLEDICISNLYVAQTWATVKILSLEVGNQDIASLESYLGLFPSLETLHVYLRDSSVIKDVDNSDRLYHLGIPVECLPRNLRFVVLRFYTGISE